MRMDWPHPAAARSPRQCWARALVTLAAAVLGSTLAACGDEAPSARREGRPTAPDVTTTSRPSRVGQLPSLDDAASVALALVGAEEAIRGTDTPLEEYARLGRVQQASYRALVADPAWLPEVVAIAPPAIRSSIERLTAAGRGLRELVGTPRDGPPDWEIVSPPPPDELRGYYRAAEEQSGVPWAYLAAIHLVETRMGRIRGLSTAGARGPMQFLPATWDAYGEGDIESPRDAILAAARYLQANGAPARMADALYRYNHSDRYVEAVTTYAREMESAEGVYLAFYHWQVYYLTTGGDLLLEEGWRR